MKKNMGVADKRIRVVIALILGMLVYFGVLVNTLATIALVVASVFVLTSLISFCPLYPILGVNTCKAKK